MAELNGEPVAPEELRALAMVNYGHFTSMRVDDQRIRGFSHHLERLVRDSRLLFGADLDRDQVRTWVRRAIGGRDGVFVVRVTVFDPRLPLARPSAPAAPQVLVTSREMPSGPVEPWRVRSATYTRDLPQVKHIGLFGALWHRRNAQLAGFDDAVFADADGCIAEGPTWNIAFYDGERVIWPDAEVLPGVTMRLLQQAHEHSTVAPVRRQDLPQLQAAFATNTTIGVRAVTAIDHVEFPADHPILDTLRKEYEEIPAESL